MHVKSILRFLVSSFLGALSLLGNGLPSVQGADPLPKELAKYDALIKPESRKHWSFQPVRKPAVPKVHDADWLRNPIDAFVLSRLEGQGWKPALPAEPRAFLRRMYLDVIGIPPTPAEQAAFDGSPGRSIASSAICCLDQAMANAGAGIGSTSCAMPKPMV